MKAQVILKATKVDGVYTADPQIDKKARKFEDHPLHVGAAEGPQGHGRHGHSLCKDNDLPIIVFNLFKRATSRRPSAARRSGRKSTDLRNPDRSRLIIGKRRPERSRKEDEVLAGAFPQGLGRSAPDGPTWASSRTSRSTTTA